MSGGLLGVGDMVFAYAYPIAFMGAAAFGVSSMVSIDPATIIANKNISVVLNVLVGVCGLISLYNWFGQQQVPVVGSMILPNGPKIIKRQQ